MGRSLDAPGPAPRTRALLTACSAASALAVLAMAVERRGPLPGDVAVLRLVRDAVGVSLVAVATAVRTATDPLPLAGVASVVVVVLWRGGRRRDAVAVIVCTTVVWAMNPLLKTLVARPRPDLWPLPDGVSEHGFPSGHAAGTAALGGAMLLVARSRWGRWAAHAFAAALVGLVGLAQLAAFVHYPSDVVAGWLVALAWIAAVAATGVVRPRPPPDRR